MGSGDAQSAIVILRTFAFFHHENIAEGIIQRAAEALKTSDKEAAASQNVPFLSQLLQLEQTGTWVPLFFRKGIRVLLSFSLIRRAAIDGIYTP